MFTDPIADMLTRIRNALAVHKAVVALPYSTMKLNLANVLVGEGYLAGVTVKEPIAVAGKPTAGAGKAAAASRFRTIEIKLKYDALGDPVIMEINRVASLASVSTRRQTEFQRRTAALASPCCQRQRASWLTARRTRKSWRRSSVPGLVNFQT